MNLAELARALRARSGLTQTALADRLGVHVRTVQAWERGGDDPRVGYTPRGEHLEGLARVAGVVVSTDGEGWGYRSTSTASS